MNDDPNSLDPRADAEPGADLTDRTLIRRFRAGDEDAATALYLRYADRLQRLADNQTYKDVELQADPEGIVQSVFRTFFRRASDGQYDVADGEDFWKLFLVIALNKIRSTSARFRTGKRDINRLQPLSRQEQLESTNQDNRQVALSNLKLTIDEILDELPEGHKEIILLRMEGYEVAEVAIMAKRAKRSVERILQEFRKNLQDKIDLER